MTKPFHAKDLYSIGFLHEVYFYFNKRSLLYFCFSETRQQPPGIGSRTPLRNLV